MLRGFKGGILIVDTISNEAIAVCMDEIQQQATDNACKLADELGVFISYWRYEPSANLENAIDEEKDWFCYDNIEEE